jgi:hypothetical protein
VLPSTTSAYPSTRVAPAGANSIARASIAQALGDEHPDVASTLNNLALVLKKGDQGGAFPGSLGSLSKVMGNEHENAIGLFNLRGPPSSRAGSTRQSPLPRPPAMGKLFGQHRALHAEPAVAA